MRPCRSLDACTYSAAQRAPAIRTSAACALAVGILALGVSTALSQAQARAAQVVQLQASFSPDVAGASTTITFGFTITPSNSRVPSPLRGVDLHLPAGLGIARNNLGTATCQPAALYAIGPQGCPANSRVGSGSALTEIPYGPEIVQEGASVFAFRGEDTNDDVTLLFFAEAYDPVYAAIVFPGRLMAGGGPFSASIDTEVPLIPSVPGGSNVSVVRFSSTFGPRGLRYEETVGTHTVYFTPRGVSVPRVCPHGGFPFAANVSFEDGSSQTVYAKAPCPASPSRR
jgi:hypothetical protein